MKHLLLLFILLFCSTSLASCPLGCGCDDDTLAVSCLYTDLQVMPITLNPGVKQLVLKYNEFTKVDASLAFYPALTLLDLSSNTLTSLPAKVSGPPLARAGASATRAFRRASSPLASTARTCVACASSAFCSQCVCDAGLGRTDMACC